jgi:serine/threonine-protein kinase 40
VGNDTLDPTRLTLNNGINHGDYIIGPLVQPVNGTPVKNISEYIAKRDGTDEFVVLKVLALNGDSDPSNEEQGRMLLYNELSILSLLQDQPGVIHQHGFFRERDHFILVLDCLVRHDFDKDGRYKHFENLQHYVIREKKLSEREALEVFSSALATVNALHQKNIVHRDLKLGNMILNRR